METTMVFMVSSILVVLLSSSANALSVRSLSSSVSTPAPAPAPDYVNLTHLLSVAGPYHTFLKYLEGTDVIQTFQNQVDNTKQGITIFAPKDQSFASLKKPPLTNLTNEQLRSLLQFHALPQYYSLADFKNLSQSNPVTTFAGGQYTLNFTYSSGTINIGSGWTNAKVSSSVHSTDPVAVYQVDKVLIPEAIFGNPPPPSPPSPAAPAPDIAPGSSAGSPGPVGDEPSPSASSASSYRIVTWSIFSYFLLLEVSGGLILFL
ncbi:PREDICTED: fasciclin-like arabinogalactan protein 7 [Nelumbo nucifera]|uniref:FAS1 domain-containing protein n=2 Tax=Nelumbo nucifera TaxID=4432 RepID=A0A822XU92_NELNU|nr:PREDICTED: fasciclin-like arabinogalactan protein 7 [Nelumbo nucifera]DAD23562.1 TPA_asm: hypothetical protein HUJ06_025025 [Nelumbo nucifera]